MGNFAGLAAIVLLGCVSPRPKPEPTPMTPVLKYQWVYCWQVCGRADRLNAVNHQFCFCADGTMVPLQPYPGTKNNSAVPEPSFVDDFFAFLKKEP